VLRKCVAGATFQRGAVKETNGSSVETRVDNVTSLPSSPPSNDRVETSPPAYPLPVLQVPECKVASDPGMTDVNWTRDARVDRATASRPRVGAAWRSGAEAAERAGALDARRRRPDEARATGEDDPGDRLLAASLPRDVDHGTAAPARARANLAGRDADAVGVLLARLIVGRDHDVHAAVDLSQARVGDCGTIGRSVR